MGTTYAMYTGYGFVVRQEEIEKLPDYQDIGEYEALEVLLEEYPLLTFESAGNGWSDEIEYAIVVKTSALTQYGFGWSVPTRINVSVAEYEQLEHASKALGGDNEFERLSGMYIG